ncbi:hypothetical protein RSOLAG1IB_09297 [Rhizoctonia solani AG-1 IB]|uniref:HAT C-terminal dimerisation domain-containing protein n=1 Tax=Thanatephorus cucumeris (strain AG1-IB / isolate 7/3/14) TaxID=1108050 RepID=A0A0B7FT14_THACB|nr:hypothetical protein RSOLAG1IB_09297 [Rhizoctonia solani AG-1 IB]
MHPVPRRPEAGLIESYLGTPVVPSYVLHQYGGVIPYWSDQLERRPRPARVVLDYLAAPASSVGAGRAFSGGLLMITHLHGQHRMSSRPFQSQMAIGSWSDTPLLRNPRDPRRATSVIEQTI